MATIITEIEFRERLSLLLYFTACSHGDNYFKSVSGPGRSGAIAAVYASHYLHIPFITHGRSIPKKLQPHLVIDTATETGKTLRKAAHKAMAAKAIAVYQEPPRIKFWYEFLNC